MDPACSAGSFVICSAVKFHGTVQSPIHISKCYNTHNMLSSWYHLVCVCARCIEKCVYLWVDGLFAVAGRYSVLSRLVVQLSSNDGCYGREVQCIVFVIVLPSVFFSVEKRLDQEIRCPMLDVGVLDIICGA